MTLETLSPLSRPPRWSRAMEPTKVGGQQEGTLPTEISDEFGALTEKTLHPSFFDPLINEESQLHVRKKQTSNASFRMPCCLFFPSPSSSRKLAAENRLPLPMLIAWGCFERRSWKLMNRCGVKGRISKDGKSLRAMEPKKTGC